MTIYEIKAEMTAAGTVGHFFDRDTMKFFHQTMRSFSVRKQDDGTYYVSAPMRDGDGKRRGITERIYNPVTKTLDFVEK